MLQVELQDGRVVQQVLQKFAYTQQDLEKFLEDAKRRMKDHPQKVPFICEMWEEVPKNIAAPENIEPKTIKKKALVSQK